MNLAIDLLVSKKRELIVLLEIAAPTTIRTDFLMRMNVYKVSEGE